MWEPFAVPTVGAWTAEDTTPRPCRFIKATVKQSKFQTFQIFLLSLSLFFSQTLSVCLFLLLVSNGVDRGGVREKKEKSCEAQGSDAEPSSASFAGADNNPGESSVDERGEASRHCHRFERAAESCGYALLYARARLPLHQSTSRRQYPGEASQPNALGHVPQEGKLIFPSLCNMNSVADDQNQFFFSFFLSFLLWWVRNLMGCMVRHGTALWGRTLGRLWLTPAEDLCIFQWRSWAFLCLRLKCGLSFAIVKALNPCSLFVAWTTSRCWICP